MGLFGISDTDFGLLLAKRHLAHRKTLAAMQSRVTQLQQANRERQQFLSLLQADIDELAGEEHSFLQRLHGEENEPDPLVTALTEQQQKETTEQANRLRETEAETERLRLEIRRLTANVWLLISPHLRHGENSPGTGKRGDRRV